MKIEFTVPFRRVPSPRTLSVEPAPEPQGRPPRIARILALAHKLDALVRSGAVSSYGELARLGHISPARLSQFMVLLHLAPVDPGIRSVSLRGRRSVHYRVGVAQDRA